MTTESTCEDDGVFDDEAYAREMREYWTWMASRPDPMDWLATQAEEDAIARMEDEGLAAARQ